MKQRRRLAYLLLAGLACASAPTVSAQQKETSAAGILSVVVENDFFAGLDRYYTGGLRASWLAANGAPRWLEPVASLLPSYSSSGARVEYTIGQNVYTPADLLAVVPDPADRPYAGWLYGSVGLLAKGDSQFDQLQITLGVIGPASGARQTQQFLHRATGSRKPGGWNDQLKNEIGANVTYQHTWRTAIQRSENGLGIDIAPHLGGAVGNVHTYANAGFVLRYGSHLPNDYGPPRVDPGLPGSGYFVPATRFHWYLFGGADGRLVARNIFLDGNTFRDSPSVDKKNLVADIQGGIVFSWGQTRVAYTHVLRTREFRTQDRRSQFGTLSVSMSF